MAKKKHSVELLIEAVNEATAGIEEVKKELKEVEGGLGSLKKKAEGVEKAIGGTRDALRILAGAEVLGLVKNAAMFAGRAIEFLATKTLEAAEAADVQDRAERDLATSIDLSGKFSEGAARRIADYAAELQKVSTVGDETSIRMAAIAINMGANEKQTKLATRAALDLAAATGKSANEAMAQLLKTLGGYAGELGEIFPQLRNLTKEQLQNGEGIRVLAERYEGAASANLTMGERLTQTKNILGDLNEQVGQSITKSERLDAVFRGLNETLSDIDFDLDTVLGDTVADFAMATIRMLRITNKAIRGIITDLVAQVAGMMTGPVGSLLAKVGIRVGDVGGAATGGGVDTFLAELEREILKAQFLGKPKGTTPETETETETKTGVGEDLGALFDSAMAGLLKMQQQLRAMDDPAETIIQKFGKMRAQVAGMIADAGDTPLAKSILGMIDEAELTALDKLGDAARKAEERAAKSRRKKMAAAEKKARDETRALHEKEMAEWEALGTQAASTFGSAFAAALSGEKGAGKSMLRGIIGILAQGLSLAIGGPVGGIIGAGVGSLFGGLIQHGGSPGVIPTGHGGLFSSEETNVRALRGEAIASRQLVAELGGPAGVAAGNAGLGVGKGMVVHIHTNDANSFDESARRGDLGRSLVRAMDTGHGPLAGAF